MIAKIFNFKQGEQGSKVKSIKQVRDQKVWKQVKGGASSMTIEQRDKQKINSKAFAIPIPTASGL